MITEARLIDDLGETAPVRLAVIEREFTTSSLGLSLAEGKELWPASRSTSLQSNLFPSPASILIARGAASDLGIKGWHQRQIRTVFGLVDVRSPRLRCCACARNRPGATVSPMVEVLPTRVTP